MWSLHVRLPHRAREWMDVYYNYLFGIAVSTVASQHESPTVQSHTEVFLYAVCMLSLDTLVSSHSPKTCMNRPQV